MALGPIQANCFILGCEKTRQAVVIDPGDDADRILATLSGDRLTLTHIIDTHGHFDHVGANKRLKEVTGADILIHSADAPMLSQLSATAAAWGLAAEDSPAADRLLEDGDTITFGTHTLTVLHTPGHTPGGIGLYTEYTGSRRPEESSVCGRHPFCRLHRQNRFSRRKFRHPDQQHPDQTFYPGRRGQGLSGTYGQHHHRC